MSLTFQNISERNASHRLLPVQINSSWSFNQRNYMLPFKHANGGRFFQQSAGNGWNLARLLYQLHTSIIGQFLIKTSAFGLFYSNLSARKQKVLNGSAKKDWRTRKEKFVTYLMALFDHVPERSGANKEKVQPDTGRRFKDCNAKFDFK